MQGSAQLRPAIRDLPGRSDAEKALAAVLTGGRLFFSHAVTIPVAGAPGLLDQGRWKEADDAVLDSFFQLRGNASPEDCLFRWTATTLVLLTGRGQIAQLPADAGLFPLDAERDLHTLRRKMDHFIAATI